MNRQEVRNIDRRAIEDYGLPGMVLMENAGRGAAEVLLSLGPIGRVVLCCGKGNNGGDGFVIARHLHNRGVPVRILLFARPEELAGDAAINYRIVEKSDHSLRVMPGNVDAVELARELRPATWVVDALFGTGLTGPVRAPLDGVIESINACRSARVLAVDLPSGLDCDTGRPMGATVRAQHTVTFVAPKQGFTNPEAAAFLGRVHVVDIGVPRALMNRNTP